MPTPHPLALAVLALLGASAATAGAQPARAPRQVLSVQPVHVWFGSRVVEYERAARERGATVAVALAWHDWDLRDQLRQSLCWEACYASRNFPGFATADVKLRLYRDDAPLDGGAVGLTLGGATWRVAERDSIGRQTGRARWSERFRPTVGATYDHAVLAEGLPIQVAAGVGVKVVLDADGTGLVPAYVTARFSVGLAY